MQAVEIVIYTSVAVIIGVMTLHFIGALNVYDMYDSIKLLISGSDENPSFAKVDKEGFVVEALNLWESCGLGEVEKAVVVHVEDEGSIDKAYVFEKMKMLNLCVTLQSAENDCGGREDADMGQIDLPAIIRLSCDPATQKLLVRE